MSSVNPPLKKYILWDNDGVLVDTEWWYFKATQRALAELGVVLEEQTYLERMVLGKSSWDLAAAMGVDTNLVSVKRQHRDTYYQAYLAHENIDIPGVERVLTSLSKPTRWPLLQPQDAPTSSSFIRTAVLSGLWILYSRAKTI